MPKSAEERLLRKELLEKFQFGCLLKRAESGDVDAQVELANKYIFGSSRWRWIADKSYFGFRRDEQATPRHQYEMGRAVEAGAGGNRRDPEVAFA